MFDNKFNSNGLEYEIPNYFLASSPNSNSEKVSE